MLKILVAVIFCAVVQAGGDEGATVATGYSKSSGGDEGVTVATGYSKRSGGDEGATVATGYSKSSGGGYGRGVGGGVGYGGYGGSKSVGGGYGRGVGGGGGYGKGGGGGGYGRVIGGGGGYGRVIGGGGGGYGRGGGGGYGKGGGGGYGRGGGGGYGKGRYGRSVEDVRRRSFGRSLRRALRRLGGLRGLQTLGGLLGSFVSETEQIYDLDGTILDRDFNLCTFSEVSFMKCSKLVEAARNSSIPLTLQCVREDNKAACISSVKEGASDIVVLGEHDYQDAYESDLKPIVYGRVSSDSLYIAVIPKNLTLIDLFTAPLIVDQTKDRAFHAAALFNMLRGHDICSMIFPTSEGTYVKIVDSKDYEPNDEEVLLCLNKTVSDFSGYQTCNFETGLQRAVFATTDVGSFFAEQVKGILDTVLDRFNNPPENAESFDFFEPFDMQSNILFKDNTVSFDLEPTYRNFVDENLFDMLHCGDESNEHSPKQLQ